ncbi:MAG: hypothetical protein U9R25_17595 [Chloroflexota bacterium]|nr:hypothetical protein [Chloroflexota bacterium]
MALTLSPGQRDLVTLAAANKVLLQGPAGTGKTTAGVHRLIDLLRSGETSSSVLVMVPQRTLAVPYSDALRSPVGRPGGIPTIVTAGGLARRMVELFWPLVAEQAGFSQPDQPPTFLTLETAQYFMARLVRPLLAEGYFESISIQPNRLYSQVIDNLNKAAVVGFPYSEIGQRLRSAWMGEPGQARVYADAQQCANLFREYCLAHNLLDFSLQVEVFRQYLWPNQVCRDHLKSTFRHIIADNIEEDTPFAHDLLRDWLPDLKSALLIYDEDGGYRQFLGADPQHAYTLKDLCDRRERFDQSWVTSTPLQALGDQLSYTLSRSQDLPPDAVAPETIRDTLVYDSQLHRYYPEMLDWVAEQIAGLVASGVSPGEIVVIMPFLSDALRYSLMNRLGRFGVPARSHRPSRALRDEPAAQCLLTLAALAHPHWGFCPSKYDVAYALVQAIDELDLVRAQLLADIVYRPRGGRPALSSFEQINPEMHERITYLLGGRYDALRVWLTDYQQGEEVPLDHFLSRLFGELLSQPGYGFHRDYDAARVAANLVESVQKFRRSIGDEVGQGLGQEYLEMVRDGVLAAQYIRNWQEADDDSVLLAPAHTFLMSNRPVDYQFWLDLGSGGWHERLYQPLTQPYVLSRHWNPSRTWTDADEFETGQERLNRLVLGLIGRCRKQIYLGFSELGERGFEHRGPLLGAINQVLYRLSRQEQVE